MPHTFGNEPTPTEPPLRWPLVVILVAVLLSAIVIIVLSDVASQVDSLPQSVAARGFTQPVPAAVPRVRPGATTPTSRDVEIKSVSAPKPAADEIEVCGLGIVKVNDQGPDPSAIPVPAPARRDTEERIWTAMQSSTDERVRAAGWLFEARLRSVVVDTERPGVPALESRALDGLAQMAANTRDPLVYRLAMEGCLSHIAARQPAGGCQLVNAEQWTRLDPANAIPWLMLAAGARERKDAAAESEAMHRASMASTSDAYWGALPKIVSQALPGDLSPLGKTVAITDAWQVQTHAALPLLSGAGAASAYCNADALRDSNRRQTCETLADVLVDKGRTALETSTGWGLRERLGWPKEKVQAMRDEQRTMLHVSAQHLTNAGELSCEGVTRMTQWAELTAQLGELGAAREVFKRSGKSLEEASREFQQRLAAQLALLEKDAATNSAAETTATATTATTAALAAR